MVSTPSKYPMIVIPEMSSFTCLDGRAISDLISAMKNGAAFEEFQRHLPGSVDTECHGRVVRHHLEGYGRQLSSPIQWLISPQLRAGLVQYWGVNRQVWPCYHGLAIVRGHSSILTYHFGSSNIICPSWRHFSGKVHTRSLYTIIIIMNNFKKNET